MLHKLIAVSAVSLLAMAGTAHAQDAAWAKQAAALALPSQMASQATVVLKHADGTSTTVQEGSNGITCSVASRDRGGASNRLMVTCLPPSLTQAMAAIDTIREKAKDRDAFRAAVEAGVKDGSITLPTPGSTGYLFLGAGDSWGKDPASIKGKSWQIVAEPMKTGAELGLPEKPDGTMPWVMAGGSPFAHIMVSGKKGS